MNISVSINPLPAPAPAPKKPVVGLPPAMLMKAGILRDPTDPRQAYLRARSLVKHGHYKEARDLVLPHARNAEGDLHLRITELLAHCAMHGIGNEWEDLLEATLVGYTERNDEMGIARTLRDLSEMLLAVGRFKQADNHLRQAAEIFERHGEKARALAVQCLRARVRMRAGYIDRALGRLNRAIEGLEEIGNSRTLAMAQLDRAKALALKGESAAAARDLVAAECYLSRSGSALDRIRARLAQAECLHILGDAKRAANGLKKVLSEVVDLEEVGMRAWVHTLLGSALLQIDPSAARQCLMRGRHLYTTLGQTYHVIRCDIRLARVETIIGLNPLSRLKQVDPALLTQWPLLAAEYNIARAELTAVRDPERARRVLFKARAFAVEQGNRSLLITIDQVLRTSSLVKDDELERLTPQEVHDTMPVVQSGMMTMPEGWQSVTGRAPEPYKIHDGDERVFASRSERKLTSPAQRAPVTIKRPKAVGVRSV